MTNHLLAIRLGLSRREHTIVMRRAPAAAAPTLDCSLTASAIAAIRMRHPLRNAPLRFRPAYIRMAASPSTARRITQPHILDPPPTTGTGVTKQPPPRRQGRSSSLRCGRSTLTPRPRRLLNEHTSAGSRSGAPRNQPTCPLDKPFHIRRAGYRPVRQSTNASPSEYEVSVPSAAPTEPYAGISPAYRAIADMPTTISMADT